MMIEPLISEELLRVVRADLAPVRPLASPARRLLALVPVAIALLVLPPEYWGWRSNLGLLGVVFSWPLSAVESSAGLSLVWLAFRGSVPGYRFSAGLIQTSIVLATALFFAVTFVTFHVAPTAIPDGAWWRLVRECIGMALIFVLPSTVLVGWMIARALPTRPALIGAAYGLGTGLMTDAGVRLFCWVSEPAHVIVGHGSAILLSVSGGAAAAVIVERRQRV